MNGKVVVVTGGTSGIGQVAAEALARRGARIVLVARDPIRAEQALIRLRQAGPEAAHTVHLADLSKMAAVRRVGADIAAFEPRIDVLVNNAGAMFSARQLTAEGLERTFATNHMSYFLLTEMLLPSLRAAGAARIVSTASDAHRGARLDLDDLQSEKSYSGFRVYSNSKLLNILWTRELARRLEGTGVVANCLHPGFVATRFGDQSGGFLQLLMPIAKLFAINPEQGAETIVHLASSDEGGTVSGAYWVQSKQAEPTKAAQDDDSAARLWEESARIAGLS